MNDADSILVCVGGTENKSNTLFVHSQEFSFINAINNTIIYSARLTKNVQARITKLHKEYYSNAFQELFLISVKICNLVIPDTAYFIVFFFVCFQRFV
jgi:hypothetical protein